MAGTELLYTHNSIVITIALFFCIIIANEAGFYIGRYLQTRTDTEIKSLTGSVQASILGLLALLLGFTFTMSMQRFDARSQALIAEANAIGTAQLRTQLLPAPHDARAAEQIGAYIDLRITATAVDLTRAEDRAAYAAKTNALQSAMWKTAVAATEIDPRPVTTGLFTQALNELIDAQARRNAQLRLQVPETVIILLFVVFISASGILGYSGGLSGRRITLPTVLMSFLICLVVFMIIDLDRPRRGFIQVDQTPLLELQAPPAAARPGG